MHIFSSKGCANLVKLTGVCFDILASTGAPFRDFSWGGEIFLEISLIVGVGELHFFSFTKEVTNFYIASDKLHFFSFKKEVTKFYIGGEKVQGFFSFKIEVKISIKNNRLQQMSR